MTKKRTPSRQSSKKRRSERGLEVCVAVSPASSREGIDLTTDSILVKAGLLYGDHVTLISLTSQLLLVASQFRKLSDKQKIRLLEKVWERSPEDALERVVVDALKLKTSNNPGHRHVWKQTPELGRMLETAWVAVERRLQEDARKAGIAGIVEALKSRRLRVRHLPLFDDEAPELYLRSLIRTLKSENAFPLFDRPTGRLINAAVAGGRVSPTAQESERSASVSLASCLFQDLPLFEQATVREILAIREELKTPLVRFRSAMLKSSKTFQAKPWDASFEQEAQNFFIREVQPAILEIREAIRFKNFAKRFGWNLLDKSSHSLCEGC